MQTHRTVITVSPDIMGGEPCFEGRRLPVEHIAKLAENGYPIADICRDYELKPDDVSVAIALRKRLRTT